VCACVRGCVAAAAAAAAEGLAAHHLPKEKGHVPKAKGGKENETE
jgi:hypothetical protein